MEGHRHFDLFPTGGGQGVDGIIFRAFFLADLADLADFIEFNVAIFLLMMLACAGDASIQHPAFAEASDAYAKASAVACGRCQHPASSIQHPVSDN
jgi:hypothetical protein